MVSKTVLRIAFVGLPLGLAAMGVSAQDPGQDDVAAAARKAREQQKTAPRPKKVVTNDDIPSAKTTTSTDQTKPASDDPQATAKDNEAAKDENDPKKEAYWRKKSQQTRDKLAQAEKDLDVLQRGLNTDQVQYYNDPQKALIEQHNRGDINEKTAKVDAKKKEIEGLKQQLSDMEDDVRKAGGDPGWVR
jgi:hypothetical protein